MSRKLWQLSYLKLLFPDERIYVCALESIIIEKNCQTILLKNAFLQMIPAPSNFSPSENILKKKLKFCKRKVSS
jgi:hypothetical protein